MQRKFYQIHCTTIRTNNRNQTQFDNKAKTKPNTLLLYSGVSEIFEKGGGGIYAQRKIFSSVEKDFTLNVCFVNFWSQKYINF